MTSLESSQYKSSVAYYQQERVFDQHNLNSIQHKLEINELQLDQLRQYLNSIQILAPTDYISTDLSAASETFEPTHVTCFEEEAPLHEDFDSGKSKITRL